MNKGGGGGGGDGQMIPHRTGSSFLRSPWSRGQAGKGGGVRVPEEGRRGDVGMR